jgi:hypothetical protein
MAMMPPVMAMTAALTAFVTVDCANGQAGRKESDRQPLPGGRTIIVGQDRFQFLLGKSNCVLGRLANRDFRGFLSTLPITQIRRLASRGTMRNQRGFGRAVQFLIAQPRGR